ncbi:MAG: amidohydrolase family protein [Clostridia bacterium]|nr:amidohydrolase family protein [Clostridia bacterium]
MYRIFDAHAHIYPEKIASKASKTIGEFYDIGMHFDGTTNTLISLGEKYGVEKFLVHSVATVPHQVTRINDFILSECALHPEKFIGFATLHPDFENPWEELSRVKGAGLHGVKLHPDFQKFEISDPKMDDAYRAMAELKLPVLFHTGDKRYNWSSPAHIPVIKKKHTHLQVICAHFGAYSEWDSAADCLKDEDVYVDTSSSMFVISDEEAKRYISLYGEDRVLFGSDYPMWSVGDEIENILRLKLPERVNEKIFSKNLSALLGID